MIDQLNGFHCRLRRLFEAEKTWSVAIGQNEPFNIVPVSLGLVESTTLSEIEQIMSLAHRRADHRDDG